MNVVPLSVRRMKSIILSVVVLLALFVSVSYTFDKTIIKQDFLVTNIDDSSANSIEE